MTRSYLLTAVAALFLYAGADVAAQSVPAPVGVTTDSSDALFDDLVFTEAELPKYDVAELVRLIRYPDDVRNNNIEGVVEVAFVLDTNGRATKLEVAASDSPLFNEAALDAVARLPFTRAMQKGKPVRIRMMIPVRFSLAE